MSVVQIAAQAGVSIATVSRVLNNSRRVNPRLAEMVHRAMAELKFDPEQIRRKSARRAEQQQASTIAIISVGRHYRGWFEIPVIAAVVAEITRVAQEQHLGTFITEMPDPTEPSPLLKRQPVDGAIVFIDSALDAHATATLAGRMPIVRVMGGQLAALEIDHVGPDNSAIGYTAARYLMDKGCCDLAFLTTRPEWDLCKLRGQGFATAAMASKCRPRVFIEGDKGDLDCVYGAPLRAAPDLPALVALLADAIRARTPETGPLGLFVSRDEETVFVYRALAAQGIQIGRDVLVVSCDNEAVRLSGLHPRPASIDLNAAQIARHGVQRLIDRIRRPHEPPVRLLVQPTLVVPPAEAGTAMPLNLG